MVRAAPTNIKMQQLYIIMTNIHNIVGTCYNIIYRFYRRLVIPTAKVRCIHTEARVIYIRR